MMSFGRAYRADECDDDDDDDLGNDEDLGNAGPFLPATRGDEEEVKKAPARSGQAERAAARSSVKEERSMWTHVPPR